MTKTVGGLNRSPFYLSPTTETQEITLSFVDSVLDTRPVCVAYSRGSLPEVLATPQPFVLHEDREEMERAVAKRLKVEGSPFTLSGDADQQWEQIWEIVREPPPALLMQQTAEREGLEKQIRQDEMRKLKKRLPCFSSISYDGKLCAERARSVSGAILDYDDGTRIEDIQEMLAGEVEAYLYTTLRHTPECHRFRLIFPYIEPIPARYHTAVLRLLAERLPGEADASGFDLAHRFIRPFRLLDDGTYRAYVLGGPGAGRLGIDLSAVQLVSPQPVWTFSSSASGRLSASERRSLGVQLGGRIVGQNKLIKGVRCPRCWDRSVWFWIDPRGLSDARCNHLNTCGWSGCVENL